VQGRMMQQVEQVAKSANGLTTAAAQWIEQLEKIAQGYCARR